MSMTAHGVPYSRAIFAARGVVIKVPPVVSILVIASEAKQSTFPRMSHGLLRFARNDGRKYQA
jgi:hypothetical protein